MRFGAIDIGTNAVRLIIKEVHEFEGSFRSFKICYTRVPIRLGADVFSSGAISRTKQNQLLQTLQAFKLLMEVQGVIEYRACSTSAMREAENGSEVVQYIRSESNVNLEILSGEDEAEALMANFRTQNLDPEQLYLFIDVGGGSTEFSLIRNGERILARSFKIGTVRELYGKVDPDEWTRLKEFASKIKQMDEKVIGIGTGGNINRIYKESGKTQLSNISPQEILKVKHWLLDHSYEERIHKLKLKPDRADVIIPAADIYLDSMLFAGVEEMIVPRLGLSDGLILRMFNDMRQSA
ncbi:MAG: exopolyphosphatase [Flavobacteriales bacterium]|nr:exopolyphosphatase [Flavobacteriales bacterium]